MEYYLSETPVDGKWFTVITPVGESEKLTAYSLNPLRSVHLVLLLGHEEKNILNAVNRILPDKTDDNGRIVNEMYCGFSDDELAEITTLKALDEWINVYVDHLEGAVSQPNFCFYVDLPIKLGQVFLRIKNSPNADKLRVFYRKLFKSISAKYPTVVIARYNYNDDDVLDHDLDPGLAFMKFVDEELVNK